LSLALTVRLCFSFKRLRNGELSVVKKSTVVAALCLMAASATGSPAVAQQASTEQILAYLDKDGDGKVGLQDYLQEQLPKLAEFDADGDGMLSKKEFTESLQGNAKKNAERSFKGFDTEGARNKLTQREFLGYHAYVFKNFFDKDNDGFVSATEWTNVMRPN